MSFQNSYGVDGSININVVPSFGHIVLLPEQQKAMTVIYLFYHRLQKLKDGEPQEVLLEADPLTSTQADTLHSVLKKSLKTQLTKLIFMNMLKDQDSAED